MHLETPMEPAPASNGPPRGPSRALLLAVTALLLAVGLLSAALVGFARSIGFVTRIAAASDTLGDVGQIAPDPALVAVGGSTTAGANPPSALAAPSSAPVVAPRASAAPSAAAPRAVDSGGAAVVASDGAADAGNANDEEQRGGSGGSGGGAETGSAGAPSTRSEDVVRSLLTWLGENNSAMCGPNTCNVGQVCCNSSCGTCVASGQTCDQTPCAGAARSPSAVLCGSGQCNEGQVCCNPSCGICTAPGETCSTESCP